jgi:anti-sigma-K factor RskA
MVASLSGERGMAVTVAFDAASRRLLVTPVTLDPGKGDAELWVIPVGNTVPVSLGVIDAKVAGSHQVDVPRAALLATGATFAISQEARGGSPTGAAQGPIVASGKLIRV